MSDRPIMDDGTPFDPSSPSHVAERLSVRTAEAERLSAELAQVKTELEVARAERDAWGTATLASDAARNKAMDERDEWKGLRDDALDAWNEAVAERDTALRALDDALYRVRSYEEVLDVSPDQVVVSRTDLEMVLAFSAQFQHPAVARLRSTLRGEGGDT